MFLMENGLAVGDLEKVLRNMKTVMFLLGIIGKIVGRGKAS